MKIDNSMRSVFDSLSFRQAQLILNSLNRRSARFWDKKRKENSLELFRKVAQDVPAYKDFLRCSKVDPRKVKRYQDFQAIPPTSKINYLRQYSLEKLSWGGSLKKSLVFTSTSGSTGEPFYFSRDKLLDFQSSIYHEMFLENDPANRRKSTLVIVGFGMGLWIGGLITFRAFQQIAERGYPISLLTPGINKEEIFEGLKRLGKKFDQVILCGYPPFIKDIVDEGEERGINWKELNMKVIFAAEAFSESFRSYVAKNLGVKNIFKDTMNIYGSADLGTMAEETPVSILIRRLSLKDKQLQQELFPGTNRIPTLVQFNPLFINFEAVSGNLLCTANSDIPLIRYDIGDQGGVYTFGEIEDIFERRGVDLGREIRRAGLQKNLTKLPFVYIFERADLSTKLYGAVIYPEHVREALQEKGLVQFLTGKFTMATKFDSQHNQFLEINIELKSKKKPSKRLEFLVQNAVVKNLLKRNGEYKNNYNAIPEKVTPRIVFWSYEDDLYFKVGVKQKWVKK